MIKAVIFDLDGTLFLGKQTIPGAPELLERLRSQGKKVIFLTNAATRSRENMAEKLVSIGLSAEKEEVYCSSYFLAGYIKSNYPDGKVFVLGEQGIIDELDEAGVEHVKKNADIVAVGLDRKLTYEKLANALQELEKGAVLVASNNDNVFPTEDGVMPGAGAIVAASKKKLI